MSDQTKSLLITVGVLAVILLICGLLIRRALRRGHISYSGNRAGMPVRTYTRTDSPLGFWAGIGVIVFIAFFAILCGAVYLLGVYGINV
jgi:hypothetical protein